MNLEYLDRALAASPPIDTLSPDEQSKRRSLAASSEINRALMTMRVATPAPDESERKRAIAKAREMAEIEARAQRVKLAPRIARRILSALDRTPTPCVLLLGPTNIGKTSAMLWLAARWRGFQVHARELASAERRHGLGEGYPPEMQQARSTPVLYLDDVGAEESRDLSALQFLLDYRYSRQLPMAATTGLTESELLAHLGAAYFRRLVDQHVPRRSGGEWPVLIVNLHEAG